MTAARAAPLQHPHKQQRDHDCSKRPRCGHADATVVAATETLEELVVDRLRLAVGDEKRSATKRHQAAERDDERRHAEDRGQRALIHRDKNRDGEAGETREGPRPARCVHQERNQHADEPHHRADRQVDVARDDHQHHHRRDDADDGRLLRDVVEVLGRQENAVREHMERDAHHDEQHAHQQQAQVQACAPPQLRVHARVTCRQPAPCRRSLPCRARPS